MKLNYKRTMLVGFAFLLISAFWQAYDAIVPLILTNHYGLNQLASGAVMSLDNIIAVFLLPIFGAISDKFNTKHGKRTPFIFIGTIIAIVFFVILALIDSVQVANISDNDFSQSYAIADTIRNEGYELIKQGKSTGNAQLVELGNARLNEAKEIFEAVRASTYAVTKNHIGSLIAFIAVLLFLLVAMATFRSPAVALMPDVTVKPLRSKGNAIINLMGTASGIVVLILGVVFKTSKNMFSSYTGYVISVAAVMAIGLVVFIFTVKEKKWAQEMQEQTERLGLDKVEEADKPEAVRTLGKGEKRSFILILASVALWFIGYNSITSKYSVYASNELGFDYNLTLIVATAAAAVAYIPVGIISSKIGRKKSILAGIVMLATAFFIGNFITPTFNEAIMYPIFMLAGIGWATINVNSFPMVVELARGSEVGKYTGYYYTASMAAQIVAPILAGALYLVFGMRETFFAFGTVFVALSFVTMFFVKHGDSIPEKRGILESLDVDGD